MNYKTHVFLAASLAIAAVCPLRAQSEGASRTINQTFNFDERGDAQIDISFQYSAAQWAEWKEQYGNRPDVLLRDLRYQLAAAVLEDFNLDKDDVQRRAVAHVKARALARYRSGGEFVIDIPKDLKLVTGANSDWFFTVTNLMNGEMVSQTLRAKLPSKAKNPHLVPAGDFNNLLYTLDLEPSRPKGWLNTGIALIVTGGALAMVSRTIKPKTSTAVIIPPPPPGGNEPPSPPMLTRM